MFSQVSVFPYVHGRQGYPNLWSKVPSPVSGPRSFPAGSKSFLGVPPASDPRFYLGGTPAFGSRLFLGGIPVRGDPWPGLGYPHPPVRAGVPSPQSGLYTNQITMECIQTRLLYMISLVAVAINCIFSIDEWTLLSHGLLWFCE